MKSKLKRFIGIFCVLLLMLGSAHPQVRSLLRQWIKNFDKRNNRLVVSGRIEVDSVHIGSKVGGRVFKINAEEGDLLLTGQAVVILEQEEILAQIQASQADLEKSEAQLALLLAGTRAEEILRAKAEVVVRSAELELRRKGFREEEIREAEAQLAASKSRLDLAFKELERARELFQKKIIQSQDLDAKTMAYETAHAGYDVSNQRFSLFKNGSRPEEIQMTEARLEQAKADLSRLENGPRPEELAAGRASVKAATANLERLKTQLKETEILSPAEAILETLDLHPGDLVRPGETVAVLNLKNTPWVRCYAPESFLGKLQVGLAVTIGVDAYLEKRFPGKIRWISAHSEFTPRNIQTTEKRMELVFEMKVEILEGEEFFRAGMFADIYFSDF